MKVYEFSAVGKPQERRFKEFSMLVASDEKTYDYIAPHGEGFNGAPFGRKWKAPNFYIEKPLLQKPDFFWIGYSVIVCSVKAREIAGEAMEMSGEFLPIRVEGETDEFWIYNVTNTINVVDQRKSEWQILGSGPDDRMLKKPVFISSRFGDETIFKIQEDRGARMYCVEFTGDSDDGEFKAVVEHHKLTGLEFKLVWIDERYTT